VRKIIILGFLALNLNGFAQHDLAMTAKPVVTLPEEQAGVITGQLLTTDNQPAADVTIGVKGFNKTTTTDENGYFTIRGLKEGTYVLEISMVGIKPMEREVYVKKEGTTIINLTLAEDAKQLSAVLVTAHRSLNDRNTAIGKLPVPTRDLPQAITVIDKGILERQQVQSMSDALQNVNGVYIMGTTGGYQEEIAARGYSFGSSNTFKNGARFNNGIRTEFSSVEKVEVLKGGNAILYGNVGAGGILNIVTKKPKFEQGGEISFRTGSYDLYKPVFDIYGPFSQSSKAAYRLNGTYEKAGSFRDGVASERIYINPSFLLKAGNKTDILLEGDYLNDSRTPDFGVGAINYTLVDVPRSRTLNVPWAYNNAQQYTATATVSHRFNEKFSLRGVGSHQNYNSEMFGAARPASMSVSSNGTWARGLQKAKTDEKYYFASLDLTAKLSTGSVGHTIVFGGDADKYRTVANTFSSYANPAINNRNIYDTVNIFNKATLGRRSDIPSLAIDRITTSPIVRYGVYVQDLISVTERLKLLAGVRYSYQSNQQARVDSVLKNKTGFTAASSADAFSPRLGVVYQPTKITSVFASYTNSFSLNSGVDVSGNALAPSIIDQFEIGVKNDLFNGALTANVTAYQIVNSNLAQTALFLADGVTPNTSSSIRELTGETTSKGVEVDLMTKPVKGFNIIAGYSYNDMRYTGLNGNTVNGNKPGDRLRYNPAHTANASVFYSFSKESKLKGFYLGAGAFYIGDRLAGRNPTNSPNNTNKLMPLPNYTTVDVNAGYALNSYAVRLKVSNLFDKLSYNAHDDNSINPIAPRLFTATFSYKF
jgi:iron complex outermembrane receptor protein